MQLGQSTKIACNTAESKGKKTLLEKTGIQHIGGKVSVKKIHGKRLLVRAVWPFESKGVCCRENGISVIV